MTNFQLQYELSVIFQQNNTTNTFLSASFLVIFDKIILHFLSAKFIYNKVNLGQKVIKFELTIEAIIVFIKSIKKGIKWYVHLIDKSIIHSYIYHSIK